MRDSEFDLLEYLEEHGVGFKEVSGGRQVILDQCPKCGKSKKFYISLETGQFICHSCASRDKEMSGGVVKLLMLLFGLTSKEANILVRGREVAVPKTQSELSLLLDNLEPNKFSFFKKQKNTYEKERPEPLALPKHFVKLYPNHPGYRYLLKRGLTAKDIETMGVFVSRLYTAEQAGESIGRNAGEARQIAEIFKAAYRDRSAFTDEDIQKYLAQFRLPQTIRGAIREAHTSLSYRGRVIFPVWENGQLFGWVARDYTGKSKLKVKNSVGTFKQFYVWNFDVVKESTQLVIAEGIVSAVKCGVSHSIATLGKYVTDEQIKGLRGLTKIQEVYICLDPDAQAEAVELRRRLAPYFKSIYNVSLPKVKLVKCPKCSSTIEIELSTDLEQVKCGSCQHQPSLLRAKELMADADFKDAGDYTQAEMDAFIKKAKSTDSDDLLLKAIFED